MENFVELKISVPEDKKEKITKYLLKKGCLVENYNYYQDFEDTVRREFNYHFNKLIQELISQDKLEQVKYLNKHKDLLKENTVEEAYNWELTEISNLVKHELENETSNNSISIEE